MKVEPYLRSAGRIAGAREYTHSEIRLFSTFILLALYSIACVIYREVNNKWALQRAKANIVEWYPVVGILDCMEQSINILEHRFPYYFRGARQIYRKIRK